MTDPQFATPPGQTPRFTPHPMWYGFVPATTSIAAGQVLTTQADGSVAWKAPTGGGGGATVQSGHGSPVGVVVPSAVPSLYVDLDTDNLYVATTAFSSSWTLVPANPTGLIGGSQLTGPQNPNAAVGGWFTVEWAGAGYNFGNAPVDQPANPDTSTNGFQALVAGIYEVRARVEIVDTVGEVNRLRLIQNASLIDEVVAAIPTGGNAWHLLDATAQANANDTFTVQISSTGVTGTNVCGQGRFDCWRLA